MSSRFPLRMISGPGHHGYEYEDRQIWWDVDDAEPWMGVRSATGREVVARVGGEAFSVDPAPSARRNPLMKKAALAFFAPLLETES